MTRYSDAALLKGDYSHMAAELRAGRRSAPKPEQWKDVSCANRAEEAAQEVARHIFAFQQSLDSETERLEIITYSAAGKIKVLALRPGEGELIRVDGVLLPAGEPASVIQHASLLSLTFTRAPLKKKDGSEDDGLKIGFVIFDELKNRQKARYAKSERKAKAKPGEETPKKKKAAKPAEKSRTK